MKLMRAALLTVCAAATAAGQSTVLFYEPFNDNSAGWTLGTTWQIGPAAGYTHNPTGAGGPYTDPSGDGSGVPGGGVAGTNIGGGVNGGNYGFRWITSPVVNAAGHDFVVLRYRRDVAVNDEDYGDSQVQVFDGTSWVAIWSATPNDALFHFVVDWQTHTLDLTPYANAALRVRWGYSSSDGFNTFGAMPGWTIDNVEITAYENSQNDLCANATALALGGTAGHLYGATPTDPQPASCSSLTTSTIDCWYTFVSPTGGEIKVTRSGGTRMALYTGSDCDNLTLVPGRCGTAATFDNVAVNAGQTYWLRLGGNVNTTHTVTVEISASLTTIGVGSPVDTVLSGSGAPVLGSVGTITLDAEPFRFGLLLMAPPNDANVYTPIGAGTIYLANPGFAVLLSYYTDAAGEWALTVPFPADPAYTGFALELQCLNFGPFAPETSNALRLVMGP